MYRLAWSCDCLREFDDSIQFFDLESSLDTETSR